MTNVSAFSKIRQSVVADQISRKRDGSIVFRDGYFYRHGQTPEQFRDRIIASMDKTGLKFTVTDFGDHWAAFNGGASLARSSHFYVEIKIDSN